MGEPGGLDAEGGGSSWMKERSGRQQSQERGLQHVCALRAVQPSVAMVTDALRVAPECDRPRGQPHSIHSHPVPGPSWPYCGSSDRLNKAHGGTQRHRAHPPLPRHRTVLRIQSCLGNNPGVRQPGKLKAIIRILLSGNHFPFKKKQGG